MKDLKKIIKNQSKYELSKSQRSEIADLKMSMIQCQQGLYLTGQRVVIVFEGFDAAGKGGVIRHLVESLDPRSLKVVPVGEPTSEQKSQHYLQRFWKDLPQAGRLVIFDRSWYGRVLVEKVDKLASSKRIQQAYQEINQFEKMLTDDGIILIKFFLVVTKEEQLLRFQERLNNPLKGWKLTPADMKARSQWSQYVSATQKMISECPGWHVIPSNSKSFARYEVLKVVTQVLQHLPKKVLSDRSQQQSRREINRLLRVCQ